MKAPSDVMNKARFASGVIVAGVLLACVSPQVQGQVNTTEPKSVGTDTEPGGPSWELEIVDGALRREGGKNVPATLKSVISYLRNRYPENVVLAPGVGDITIEDLKLANFEWSQGLEALKVASGDAFVWSRRVPGEQTVDPTTGMPIQTIQGNSYLYVLNVNPEGPSTRPRRLVEVFNLANYLRGGDSTKALAEIEMILRETLTQIGRTQGAGPRMQFHPSAGLLIVIGSDEEIAVAQKVILALPEVSSSRAAGMMSSGTGMGMGAGGGMGGGMGAGGPGATSGYDPAILRRYGLAPGGNQPANPTKP